MADFSGGTTTKALSLPTTEPVPGIVTNRVTLGFIMVIERIMFAFSLSKLK